MATTAAASTNAAGVAAARKLRASVARTNIRAFIEFVMKDERTGAPIVLADMHSEWHRLIDQHPRLVLLAFVEAGKSNAITVARTLFELGRDPSKRIAIISNVAGQAQKLLGSVSQYIEHSPELHEVFPHLKPGSRWASNAITVKRPTISKDPSVQALGVHGPIMGSRLDLVIVDDILDYENTRTQEQRAQALAWFDSTVLGRVVANGRVIVLGNAWHPEDLLHKLAAREKSWVAKRYGIVDEQGNPRWGAVWPLDRIAAKRLELGPLESARALDCLARADETSIFREDWIATAIERSRGMDSIRYLATIGPGCFTVCGVDLGISKKRTADLSAITTVFVNERGHRELLNVESGRWDVFEIMQRIRHHNARYQPSHVVVESVQAQQFVVDLVKGSSSIPVVGFKTGGGQMSLQYQANALAGELSKLQWTIRATSPEVQALIRDLLYWSPIAHTGDRLASLLMARWGIEQASRRIEPLGIDFSRR
jgi:hypothetical protein